MTAISHITCIGEVLVDFLSTKRTVDISRAPGFLKFAGGASANVAVGLAKLGIRSAFVGAVGDDSFGKFLGRQLQHHHVEISGLKFMKGFRTRLAFISLNRTGEREFEFWERHPADCQLKQSDIHMKKLLQSDIVHISSFLLLQEPSRSTALSIADTLTRKRRVVSFDPNLRLSLWDSHEIARRLHLEMIERCSILKMNETEALFLTRKKTLSAAVKALSLCGPQLIVVTMGKTGCLFWSKFGFSFVKGFHVQTVDTTGCGDGFLSGLLSGIVQSKKTLERLSLAELYMICRYANAVGAMTASKRGAIDALPSFTQVRKFLNTHHS